MPDLIPFVFEEHTLRVLLIDEAPWWVASDICALLDLHNPTRALAKLDVDQFALHPLKGLRGDGLANIVSESGMWTLVLRSDKPQARRVRRWLTDEVLPQLRRTGAYAFPGHMLPADPAPSAMLAAQVAAVREARRLYGMAGARALWVRLGLPDLQITDETHVDQLVTALRPWLIERDSTTHDEVAAGIGLIASELPARLAIGKALRQCGWHPRKERRRGYSGPVYVFRPAVNGFASHKSVECGQ